MTTCRIPRVDAGQTGLNYFKLLDDLRNKGMRSLITDANDLKSVHAWTASGIQLLTQNFASVLKISRCGSNERVLPIISIRIHVNSPSKYSQK